MWHKNSSVVNMVQQILYFVVCLLPKLQQVAKLVNSQQGGCFHLFHKLTFKPLNGGMVFIYCILHCIIVSPTLVDYIRPTSVHLQSHSVLAFTNSYEKLFTDKKLWSKVLHKCTWNHKDEVSTKVTKKMMQGNKNYITCRPAA